MPYSNKDELEQVEDKRRWFRNLLKRKHRHKRTDVRVRNVSRMAVLAMPEPLRALTTKTIQRRIDNARRITFSLAEAAARKLGELIETNCEPRDRTGRRLQWEAIKAVLSRVGVLESQTPIIQEAKITLAPIILDMRNGLVLNAARVLQRQEDDAPVLDVESSPALPASTAGIMPAPPVVIDVTPAPDSPL